MEPLHPFRQPGQVGSRNTEPRIGRRRIIEVGRHRRIGRVHPQPAGYAVQQGPGAEALPLSQRIERNVVAATHYLRKIVFGIDRRIGMRPAAILFEHEARFRHGTRRSPVGMFPQQREYAPHRTRLQRHDYFYTRSPTHLVDDRKVPAQQPFVEHEAGRRHLIEIHHDNNFCKYTNIRRRLKAVFGRQPDPQRQARFGRISRNHPPVNAGYGSAKCAAVPVSEKIYRAAFPGCRPAPCGAKRHYCMSE